MCGPIASLRNIALQARGASAAQAGANDGLGGQTRLVRIPSGSQQSAIRDQQISPNLQIVCLPPLPGCDPQASALGCGCVRSNDAGSTVSQQPRASQQAWDASFERRNQQIKRRLTAGTQFKTGDVRFKAGVRLVSTSREATGVASNKRKLWPVEGAAFSNLAAQSASQFRLRASF